MEKQKESPCLSGFYKVVKKIGQNYLQIVNTKAKRKVMQIASLVATDEQFVTGYLTKNSAEMVFLHFSPKSRAVDTKQAGGTALVIAAFLECIFNPLLFVLGRMQQK